MGPGNATVRSATLRSQAALFFRQNKPSLRHTGIWLTSKLFNRAEKYVRLQNRIVTLKSKQVSAIECEQPALAATLREKISKLENSRLPKAKERLEISSQKMCRRLFQKMGPEAEELLKDNAVSETATAEIFNASINGEANSWWWFNKFFGLYLAPTSAAGVAVVKSIPADSGPIGAVLSGIAVLSGVIAGVSLFFMDLPPLARDIIYRANSIAESRLPAQANATEETVTLQSLAIQIREPFVRPLRKILALLAGLFKKPEQDKTQLREDKPPSDGTRSVHKVNAGIVRPTIREFFETNASLQKRKVVLEE